MSPVALLLMACAPTVDPADLVDADPHDTGSPGDVDTAPVYDHVLDIQIELDPGDWAELRGQTRSFTDVLVGEDCQDAPYESPFSWFEGSATIDGQRFDRVDVRKKGFLGSLSEEKPALKLDLVEFEEQDFLGARRLTLNNAVSDPAYLRQCLGYSYFADLGLPASQCGFARVSVNGEDLGVYVNIEPIKAPLLNRHFDSSDGNLYELTLSDFREGWTNTIEKKNNEAAADWSDIDGLVTALEADDDQLMAGLDAVVDVDAFIRYWVGEVMISHLDGYAWNTNNAWMYADPNDDDRMHFIVWGIDGAFATGQDEESTGPVRPEDVPAVLAFGQLANRLYAHPDGFERYAAEVRHQLDNVWNEDTLRDRMDTWDALIQPELTGGETATVDSAIRDLRELVDARRGVVEETLGDRWEYGQRDTFCMELSGSVEATFDTTWGSVDTVDIFSVDNAELSLVMEEESFAPDTAGAVAGWSEEGEPIIYIASWISPTEIVLVYVAIDAETLQPGSVSLDLSTTISGLFYMDTTTMDDFEFLSYVVGEMRLDDAGTNRGDAISGGISGEMLQWGW